MKGEKQMGLQNTLKALADPTRREILNLLKKGRLSAGEIADRFPVTAASISRHLSVLKEADLIRDTREGKYIYYEQDRQYLIRQKVYCRQHLQAVPVGGDRSHVPGNDGNI